MRKRWHLDTAYPAELFSGGWGADAHAHLLELFRYVEASNLPVLSTLPPGIDPAGAAAAAAMYFLPSLGPPPQSHCRIALYPGLHFSRLLKRISYMPLRLHQAGQIARAMQRGTGRMQGPFEKLMRRRLERDLVNFHWIFRCQAIWSQYFKEHRQDLLPRGYFGRDDSYDSTLDLILGDSIRDFGNPDRPYDLLVYCPYFHASNFDAAGYGELAKKIAAFPADRKLILARSAYDFWSNMCEDKFCTKGLGIPARLPGNQDRGRQVSGVEFELVEQLLSVEDAYILYHEFRRAFDREEVDRQLLLEVQTIAKQLFVRVDPHASPGEPTPEESADRLAAILGILPLERDSQAHRIVGEVASRIGNRDYMTKVMCLQRVVASGDRFEVWVTKDADKRALENVVGTYKDRVVLMMADGRSAFGERHNGARVIIPRVDKSHDLNLVSYLEPRDVILVSAWEAVSRMGEIMRSWEKSEKWRENAELAGIVRPPQRGEVLADPVLDLANYVDKIVAETKAKLPHADGTAQIVERDHDWWGVRIESPFADTYHDRDQLLINTGEKNYECREVALDGGLGIFVRVDDEIQVVVDDEEGEILDLPVGQLKPGMRMLIFKDAERSSFFDLVMNQLEKSVAYSNDVKNVKFWKGALKEYALSKGLRAAEISEILGKSGKTFDPVTVRSWIQGSTMAPRRKEYLQLVVVTLGLKEVNVESTYGSVRRLRGIAINLGKALNHVILHRSMENVEVGVQDALVDAGVDIDELAAAVESRKIFDLAPGTLQVEGKNIRKMFKMASDEMSENLER